MMLKRNLNLIATIAAAFGSALAFVFAVQVVAAPTVQSEIPDSNSNSHNNAPGLVELAQTSSDDDLLLDVDDAELLKEDDEPAVSQDDELLLDSDDDELLLGGRR